MQVQSLLTKSQLNTAQSNPQLRTVSPNFTAKTVDLVSFRGAGDDNSQANQVKFDEFKSFIKKTLDEKMGNLLGKIQDGTLNKDGKTPLTIGPVKQEEYEKLSGPKFDRIPESNPTARLAQTQALYMHAVKNGYAIPAFNINMLEQVHGILAAVKGTNSPVILQVTHSGRDHAGAGYLTAIAEIARKEAAKMGVPVLLHLDHGNEKSCMECIDAGYDSVMFDGSDEEKFSFQENIDITGRIVKAAHAKGVFVEAEVGALKGNEDGAESLIHKYTKPQDAKRLVAESGCDSLAISIGTGHGPDKAEKGEESPNLKMGVLGEIQKAVESIDPNNDKYKFYPFVLHGASSAPKRLYNKANEYVILPRKDVDKLKTFIPEKETQLRTDVEEYSRPYKGTGVSEDQYSEVVGKHVAKINVDTDFRIGVIGKFVESLAESAKNNDMSLPKDDPRRVDNTKRIDTRTHAKFIKSTTAEIAMEKINMMKSQGRAIDFLSQGQGFAANA